MQDLFAKDCWQQASTGAGLFMVGVPLGSLAVPTYQKITVQCRLLVSFLDTLHDLSGRLANFLGEQLIRSSNIRSWTRHLCWHRVGVHLFEGC